MKVALIIPANRWKCPYVDIYTRVLDEVKIEYDIISWNREGDEDFGDFQFDARVTTSTGNLEMIFNYVKYASYVKNIINKNGYDKLIVFTPQVGIFLYSFLRRKFPRRFIMDYRDLSIEQKPYFRWIYSSLLNYSYANIISSPGFKKYLPKRSDYILSHNFNIHILKNALKNPLPISPNQGIIDILTIGGIRDFDSNSEVILSLSNKKDFSLRFVGKGSAAEPLKNLCKENNVSNVSFHGYYNKEDEPGFIDKATFINIYYPRKPSHDTAISNRFYNSLIFRKPMIVTSNTTQGEYATQYGVGVAVDNCSNLSRDLVAFLNSNSYKNFTKNADFLLNSFLKDYNVFKDMLMSFCKGKV